MQGPPQGPPACAASTGVSFLAHQHREDSASPTSARSCTARLAARLAAPGCAAHPRGPPRARCPNLPRTQARAESVLHAPSWTRRLLAAPVHPASPRSPALDTCAARARRWPAPARLRQHAHRLSRWLFAIERLRIDCGRVLFGNRVAKREAEGTVHTKHQLNLDPKPD